MVVFEPTSPLQPHSLIKASLVFVLKVGHRAALWGWRAPRMARNRTSPGTLLSSVTHLYWVLCQCLEFSLIVMMV